MGSSLQVEQIGDNPLDLIEYIAAGRQWAFERGGDEEITLSLPGQWAEYQLTLNWNEDIESLHMACMFDFKAPEARRSETGRLILRLNEQLWLGNFDLWRDEGALLFRYGALLAGGADINISQCETMLQLALEACERFYPAFQYVIWAGHSAEEAMEISLFETVGSA